MKRFFHFMTVIALAALTLTGCDDVPMPYNQPNIKPNEPSGTSSLPYSDSNLKDWTVSTVTGADWSLGSTYAKATGYNGGTTTATETWLVSPTINTTTSDGAVINFDHVIRYVKSATDINNHEMYISSDYTGDVKTATWTKLDYKPVESATQTWDFYAADPIQIPDAYLNKNVVIAFKFTCNDQNSTTWEIKNFSIKEGKAETGGGDTPAPGEPKGDGSQANPYNAAAANKAAAALSADGKLENIYVSGIVSKIGEISTQFGNATYYLSEDGTTSGEQFEVFRGLYTNGAKFTSEDQLKVGQKVTVLGTLVNFKGNTPEMAQGSKIVSIEGSGTTPENPETPGTSEGITIDGTTVTLTNPKAAAGTESVTLDLNSLGLSSNSEVSGPYSFSDGTTFTVAQGKGMNAPIYHSGTKGFRIYACNTITFNAIKKIAKIVFTCDSYKGTDYVGNATQTITFDGNTATYNNYNAEGKGGTQIRIKTITITYAK
jgi:hypothetical protein